MRKTMVLSFQQKGAQNNDRDKDDGIILDRDSEKEVDDAFQAWLKGDYKPMTKEEYENEEDEQRWRNGKDI